MHGAGLSPSVVGKTSSVLFHVSDWYKTLISAADLAGTSADLKLKPNERPFIDGDGLDNWLALSTSDHDSLRDEIFIAGQAQGSRLRAHALRWEKPDFIGMKLLYNPSLLYNMPGWYPPPGKAWNYSNTPR